MKFAVLVSLWLAGLSTLASAADGPVPPARVFDIVPPEGREVQWVDDLTVLRQPGTKFGAVLTFMPESATSAWIPVAVLNTSGGPLKVGTRGVSARYGDTPLKVWSTSGLVRLAKEGRISAPAAMVASPAAGASGGVATSAGPVA